MNEVIRGSMGTIAERHQTNSEIRKIKLLPIELRRPSILRASGPPLNILDMVLQLLYRSSTGSG